MLSTEPSKLVSPPRTGSPHPQPVGELETVYTDTLRLQFSGDMTLANSQEFEETVIDALRRYRHLELDLSGVDEIDLYGIHLLGLLHQVVDSKIVIVASSPVVASATRRMFAPAFTPTAAR